MYYSHFMQVHHRTENTLHHLCRILLGEVLLLADLIEQFAALAQLGDEVKVILPFVDFVQL